MCVVEVYGGEHCIGKCLEPRDCTDEPYPLPPPSTFASFLALPLAEREALNRRWLALAITRTAETDRLHEQGDYTALASYRRFEIGE